MLSLSRDAHVCLDRWIQRYSVHNTSTVTALEDEKETASSVGLRLSSQPMSVFASGNVL